MAQADLAKAMQTFGLVDRPSRALLEAKRKELLATWHPHRYANLTNNPRKYMQMYKKGEAMTKEIQAAYEILVAWLTDEPPPTAPSSL